MKIIIAGTAYPMRGAFAQLNAILYTYLKKKYEVKVFSFKRQYPGLFFPGTSQFEEGEEIVKIEPKDKFITIDSVNPYNWIATGYKIGKQKPALIIFRYWLPFFAPCFGIISFIAKRFSNARVLFICDNVIPHERRFGDKILTRFAFSQADYFIIHSRSVEEELKRFNKNKPYKYSPHPVYNIYGEKLEKQKAKEVINKEFHINLENDKVILFFGYIRKYKGLLSLINSMPFILEKNDVKLLVVGEFYDDEQKYREEVKKLRLEDKIIFISGFVPSDKVRYFFSACDVVILPYTSATQSGIIQIAYYYDKPVIASNVGGLAEYVVHNKTGLLVNDNNTSSLSAAVNNFYDNNLEQKFFPYVSEEKKKYEWETFIKDIEELTQINKS